MWKKRERMARMFVLAFVAAVVALEGFLIANTAGQPGAAFVAGAYGAFERGWQALAPRR